MALWIWRSLKSLRIMLTSGCSLLILKLVRIVKCVGRRHSRNLLRKILNRPETLPADSDNQEDFGFGFYEDSTFFTSLTFQVNNRLGSLGVFSGILLSSGKGVFLVESNSFFSSLAAGIGFSLKAGISLLLLLNVFRNLANLISYLTIRLILN